MRIGILHVVLPTALTDFVNGLLRVEMLTPGLAEALTLGTARRADRKSPTPVARRSAGMLCGLPSHQAWNPKSAPVRDDDWGVGLPPLVRIQGDAPQGSRMHA